LILPTFAQEQISEVYSQLDIYFKHQTEAGMTAEKYAELAATITPEELKLLPPPPPSFVDFPYELQEAFRLYNTLPNKIDGMAGFTGKDLSILPTLFEIYAVPRYAYVTILEFILYLTNKDLDRFAKQTKTK
jgi:hypothetical protein